MVKNKKQNVLEMIKKTIKVGKFLKEGDIEDSDLFLDSLPPGYRFGPTDEQLIIDYLKPKNLDQPLPINRIKEVMIYCYSPQKLSDMYKIRGEKAMYLFTPRCRNYPYGRVGASRCAGNGHWKATGDDTPVGNKEEPVGYRRTLVFYERNRNHSTETNWIMHEYRIDPKDATSTGGDPLDKKMLNWVLCKVYNKEENNPDDKEEELTIVPGMINPYAQMCGVPELQTNQCPRLSEKPPLFGMHNIDYNGEDTLPPTTREPYAPQEYYPGSQSKQDAPFPDSECGSNKVLPSKHHNNHTKTDDKVSSELAMKKSSQHGLQESHDSRPNSEVLAMRRNQRKIQSPETS